MSAVHKINVKSLIICLAISLGVGGLSGLLSMGSMQDFDSVAKPPLAPPDWLFPIVWTVLFALMGISSYIIFNSQSPNRTRALIIYGLQLAVNFFWPIIFFNFRAYLFSFIWILLLWILIIIMILFFYEISKPASLLQIPYLLWVTFAAYLTFGVFLLN